jgi:hypothetical protein
MEDIENGSHFRMQLDLICYCPTLSYDLEWANISRRKLSLHTKMFDTLHR